MSSKGGGQLGWWASRVVGSKGGGQLGWWAGGQLGSIAGQDILDNKPPDAMQHAILDTSLKIYINNVPKRKL